MLNKIIPKSEFSRNIATLMLGTAAAQAISVAISPVLTRIFSPADFGIYALYLSIVSILSVIVAGRYELAITLPKKDRDAVNLVALSCIISFFFSLVCFIVACLFNREITVLLKNPDIGYWLYFIPVSLFFTGIFQSFNYWQNRKKKYKILSKSRITQTVTTSSVNLGLGFTTNGVGGLTLGNIIGQGLSACYLAYYTFLNDKDKFKGKIYLSRILSLAKRYKNFPKFDAFAALLNISSNQMVPIFLNIFFGVASSGYFFLTQRILGLPITVIAMAVQDVFKMEVTTLHNNNGNTRKLFISTFSKLFFLAIVPTILLYCFSVKIFVLFFGARWLTAGIFVQIMIPAFFLRFLSFPLGYILYVVEKQYYNTILQIGLFILILTSIYVSRNYNIILTVKLMTISYCLYYLIYLILSYKFTSKGVTNINKYG